MNYILFSGLSSHYILYIANDSLQIILSNRRVVIISISSLSLFLLYFQSHKMSSGTTHSKSHSSTCHSLSSHLSLTSNTPVTKDFKAISLPFPHTSTRILLFIYYMDFYITKWYSMEKYRKVIYLLSHESYGKSLINFNTIKPYICVMCIRTGYLRIIIQNEKHNFLKSGHNWYISIIPANKETNNNNIYEK